MTKSKQLDVTLRQSGLRVGIKDEPEALVEGEFPHLINSAESMWILTPGEYVQISLEKAEDAWWDCLLNGEGKIDLSKIDAEMSFNDLGEEEQQTFRRVLDEQRLSTPDCLRQFQ